MGYRSFLKLWVLTHDIYFLLCVHISCTLTKPCRDLDLCPRHFTIKIIWLLGGTSETEPPVPFPNTVVKRFSTDDTPLATAWENRPLPGGFFILPVQFYPVNYEWWKVDFE